MGDEGLITPRTPTRQRIQDLVLAGPTPRVAQMVSEPVNELMVDPPLKLWPARHLGLPTWCRSRPITPPPTLEPNPPGPILAQIILAQTYTYIVFRVCLCVSLYCSISACEKGQEPQQALHLL